MAIYVGLKVKSREGVTRTSSFNAKGNCYGTLKGYTETKEIVLLHAEADTKRFAFPRASRGIENAFGRGGLPAELCCAA